MPTCFIFLACVPPNAKARGAKLSQPNRGSHASVRNCRRGVSSRGVNAIEVSCRCRADFKWPSPKEEAWRTGGGC